MSLHKRNNAIINHLSKALVVSSSGNNELNFVSLRANSIQLYQEHGRIIARNFDTPRMQKILETPSQKSFDSPLHENLSEILFANAPKNLKGNKLYVAYHSPFDVVEYNGKTSHWRVYFCETLAQKLDATIEYIRHDVDTSSDPNLSRSCEEAVEELEANFTIDIYLNNFAQKADLESYNQENWCFLVPLPPKVKIY